MKKFTFLFAFSLFFTASGFAQKTWTLQDCFDHAMQNNISVKQVELSKDLAQNNLRQSKMNIYLPNINAGVTQSFNFGNSVDPTTYQFVNSATNSTRFSLSLNYNLFEGLTRINSIKANKEKLSASEFEIEELKNNTKLLITNLYLQIVVANEVLELNRENKKLTQNQFNNTSALVDAGIVAQGAVLDIKAQLAQNDLDILNAENTLEKTLNQLKLLLQLDPYEAFGIAEIDVPENLVIGELNPEKINQSALNTLPQIKAADLRLKAAEFDLKATKGSLLPTLSLSGFVGTNYFSAAQEVTSTQTVNNPINVDIGGTPVVVNFPSEQPVFSKTNFGKQLGNNLSENISLSLNIPILGAWQRRTAISNAKLNVLQSTLEIDVKKQQLNQDVFTAYTDLRMAYNRYEVTKSSIEATTLAYDYANEKYRAGLLNALEFETARNRKIAAKANQVQAKYEYFFRKIILDYYQTGTLSLD
ncbi:MAG: TolC family protein [Chitinophagales bacterium]